jgi:hypothetical protein
MKDSKNFLKNGMKGKGPLCVALVVTRHGKKTRNAALTRKPCSPDGGGQVMGLGKISGAIHLTRTWY